MMVALSSKVWEYGLLLLFAVTRVMSLESGMTSQPFKGLHNIQEVQCSGKSLPTGSSLYAMVLYDKHTDTVLSLADLSKNQCSTAHHYVSCQIDSVDHKNSRLSVLVANVPEDRSREFGCNASILTSEGRFRVVSWSLVVRHIRTTTPSPPSTTTTTTTTVRPQPPNKQAPVASGVMGNVQEFQLPISVVIIGLVLLLFFAILCAILVILQCRGRRRRRSRAANRESLLSTKSEPVEGGYRTTRSVAGYPPGHLPPETPAGNFAMRYQKSIPDTGYVSGSSVYYSEPYGTLDDEIKERLRPNPRMCHIPYDLKGGVLDTHPQEHSA